MKLMGKAIRNENGQVLVAVALMMVALVGFAGLIVDIGVMQMTKANLQNAADAAALAGVQALPNESNAINTAIDYAGKNGMKALLNGIKKDGDTITVTPLSGSTKVEVVCTRTVPFSFAKVLGLTDGDVSARAVAKRVWAGQALPFLNLTNRFFSDDKLLVWNKEAPGTFGSIWKDDRPYDALTTSFTIGFEDGIMAEAGRDDSIKKQVGDIYALHRTQYIFSLSQAAIQSGKYEGKVGNKEVIPLGDLVLLQVSFDSYDSGKSLSLTWEKTWDINNGEYPTDFITDGISSLED